MLTLRCASAPMLPLLMCTAGFLSLDADGRVVRVDTLAKLLGPGFRLGWLSGPPPLVAKLGLYMAGISIGANMVSQVRYSRCLLYCFLHTHPCAEGTGNLCKAQQL